MRYQFNQERGSERQLTGLWRTSECHLCTKITLSRPLPAVAHLWYFWRKTIFSISQKKLHIKQECYISSHYLQATVDCRVCHELIKYCYEQSIANTPWSVSFPPFGDPNQPKIISWYRTVQFHALISSFSYPKIFPWKILHSKFPPFNHFHWNNPSFSSPWLSEISFQNIPCC